MPRTIVTIEWHDGNVDQIALPAILDRYGMKVTFLVNTGPIVCACFGVGRVSISDAIASGAQTAGEIGARVKAGTNCGSCIPELKAILSEMSAAAS